MSDSGVHARWKWLTTVKRGIKFGLLNALLKLFDYLDTYQNLPAFEHIYEVMALERYALYARLRNNRHVGDGLRVDQINFDRYNLTPAEVNLLRDRRLAKPSEQVTAAVAWGNYVKGLFKPDVVYEFTNLHPDRYLYVAENKSLPNREARARGEAIGRELMVIWFKKADEQPDTGTVLVPTADLGRGEIELVGMTIAEISRAAGLHPDVPAAASDRDAEILQENILLDESGVVAYSYERVIDEESPSDWLLLLQEPGMDIEDKHFDSTPFDLVTNMALARVVQRRDGLDNDQRDRLWNSCTKRELMIMLLGDDAEAAPAEPELHAARGRGRGALDVVRGRGRGLADLGRGRGRGPGKGRGRGHDGGDGRGRGRGLARGGRGRGRGVPE